MLPISERAFNILVCVIELFSRSGEPVGSSTVAAQDCIGVSSATVRNVMSGLEEDGLLYQPHTSAGRMPTWSAMRLYVDHLVASGQTASNLEMASQFGQADFGDVDSIVRAAGLVISELSQLTSIVSSPEVTEFRLKDLHLSWLSPQRILVILVTQDGRVFNRAIRVDEPMERTDLQRMQNFLSELVVGLSLREVRRRVRRQLDDAQMRYRKHLRRALEIGQEVVEMATRSELFVEGAVRILEVSELVRDIERARDVMRRLEDRERVLEVLDRVCETPRAQTLIGPELGDPWGSDLSLVACRYFHDGRQVGLVGILGPMRMDYARMIPLVEQAAGMLSKELEDLA